MDKKQKEFWKQFCQSKNKDEETLKKSLFNGDLTKEEFEYVISCVIGPLSAPSLFYPALFKKCSQRMDRCNWTMLNHVEWRYLLMEYPQFADAIGHLVCSLFDIRMGYAKQNKISLTDLRNHLTRNFNRRFGHTLYPGFHLSSPKSNTAAMNGLS